MKVLLIDDHPLILSALSNIIHTLDDSTVVLTAENPPDAFALLAGEAGVELVLLDLLLGQGVDGFAVLAELRERYPALPVVVISAIDRLADMVRVVDMGAMGFVPKCSPVPALVEALALVLTGGVYIPPALLGLVRLPGMNLADAAAAADAAASRLATDRLAGTLPASATSPVQRPMSEPARASAAGAGPGPGGLAAGEPAAVGQPGAGIAATRASMAAMGLTPRQTDVLLLLLKGLPNKLIARELNVSVDTVKDHVAAVLRALGVGSRTQAVLVVGRLAQSGH